MKHAARWWLGWELLWVSSGCVAPSMAAPLTPEQIDQVCNHTGSGRLPAEFFAPEPASSLPVPSPQPSSEQLLSPKEGHTRLAMDPTAAAYRARIPGVCLPENGELVSFVHICVDERGTVTRVEVVKGSKPILDDQLPEVIGRWKYRPYAPNGTPVGFCYNMAYRVSGSKQNH